MIGICCFCFYVWSMVVVEKKRFKCNGNEVSEDYVWSNAYGPSEK